MYGRHPVADTTRATRAILSNMLARATPGLYMRLTGESGRGPESETPDAVADYFQHCFLDYFRQLGIEPEAIPDWLQGKALLEYGPGDVPGVGLLMLAHGAETVTCVDRFPLSQRNRFQIAVLHSLMDRLEGETHRRARDCFVEPGDPVSGFRPQRLDYHVTPDGTAGLEACIDLVYSRAVLEHVNDLDATFLDMAHSLKPDGIAIHQVDLKSHGLHRENPLDFLTWPVRLWDLMYAGKGVPNRWRLDRYHAALERAGLEIRQLEPTAHATPGEVAEVRPWLARPFRELDDDTLRCLGFWLVASRPAGATPGGETGA